MTCDMQSRYTQFYGAQFNSGSPRPKTVIGQTDLVRGQGAPDRSYPKIAIGQTEQTSATLGQTKRILAAIGQTEQTLFIQLARPNRL